MSQAQQNQYMIDYYVVAPGGKSSMLHKHSIPQQLQQQLPQQHSQQHSQGMTTGFVQIPELHKHPNHVNQQPNQYHHSTMGD
jgi:hypothetical protein